MNVNSFILMNVIHHILKSEYYASFSYVLNDQIIVIMSMTAGPHNYNYKSNSNQPKVGDSNFKIRMGSSLYLK